MLANGIEIILGNLGDGTLDGFVGPRDGTILTTDLSGQSGTVTIAAIAQIESDVPINFESTGTITAGPSIFSIPLQTGPGTTATFTTDFPGGGDIDFEAPFGGLFTNGGDLTISAGDSVSLGTAAANAGDVEVTAGTQVTGGSVEVSDFFGDSVRVESDGPVELNLFTASTGWVSSGGDITTAANGNIQATDGTFISTGGGLGLGNATGSTFDVDALSLESASGTTTVVDADDLRLYQVNVGGTQTSIQTGADLNNSPDLDMAFLGLLSTSTFLDVGGDLNFADGNATTNENFFFGQISAQVTGDATFHADTVDGVLEFFLPDSISADTLTITTSGNVLGNQTGLIDIAGTTSISALGEISLGNSASNLGNTVNASGTDISLIDVGDLNLGDIDATGNLTVTSSGSITDAGGTQSGDSIDVAGITSLSASGDIALDDVLNNFDSDDSGAGDIDATAVAITLTDIDTIQLGTINTGSLTVSSVGGSISDTPSENIDVSGSTSVTAQFDITLDNIGHNFNSQTPANPNGTDVLSASGQNVTISDTDSIQLGNLSVTGNLTLGATDLVSDLNTDPIGINTTGVSSVLGLNIELDNTDNSFGSDVNASAINISLASDGSIILADIDASGNLTVDSGGDISDGAPTSTEGDINVVGQTSLSGTGAITLDDINNDFLTVDATGLAITLTDVNDIILDDIDAFSLTVVSGGSISDGSTGSTGEDINVTDVTSLTATGGDITIDDITNDFAELSATTNTLTAADTDDIVLNDLDLLALDLNAGGAITDGSQGNPGDDLNIVGLSFLVSGDSITVDDATNDFGELSATANTLTAMDTDDIVLGDLDLLALDLNAGGAITDGSEGNPGDDLNIVGLSFLVSGDSITVDDATNNFGELSATANTLTAMDTDDIVLGDLDLLALDLNAGGAITDGSQGNPGDDLNIVGLSFLVSGDSITVDDATNDFGELSATANTLTAMDTDDIVLGDLDLLALDLNAGGAITDGSEGNPGDDLNIVGLSFLVSGDSITVDDATNDFGELSATANTLTAMDTDDIILNDLDLLALDLNASGAITDGSQGTPGDDLNIVGLSFLVSGDSITVDDATNDFGELSAIANTLTAMDTDDIVLNDLDLLALDLNAGGAITDGSQGNPGDDLNIVGLSFLVSGDSITVDDATNDFGELSATANTLTAMDTDDIVLNDLDLLALDLNAGGAITDGSQGNPGDDLNIVGLSFLVSGDSITVDDATNDFGELSAIANTLTAMDTDDIVLNDLDLLALDLNAGGAITDGSQGNPGDDLNIVGLSFLVSGDSITVDDATNDFGELSAIANTLTAMDTDDIVLGDLDLLALDLNAGGAITDGSQGNPGDDLNIVGLSFLVSGDSITVDDATNDFGELSATANTLTAMDTDDIILNDLDLLALDLNAGGAITDGSQGNPGDDLNIVGLSFLVSGDSITVDDATNDFGELSATANTLTAMDTDDIVLGEIDVQSLTVTAGGEISDTPGSAVKVSGATSLTATENGSFFDIVLDNVNQHDFSASNDFSASGNDIRVDDLDAIQLGQITSTGALSANGNGLIVVPSSSTIVANLAELNTEPGSGGNATIQLQGTISAHATTLTGTSGDDLFDIVPQQGTLLEVIGGDEQASSPGDSLIVDDLSVGAVIDEANSDLILPDGVIQFQTPFVPILFSNIETLLEGVPQVEDATISGTTWNLTGPEGDFSLIDNAPRVLPWSNTNKLAIQFDSDVQVTAQSFQLLGTNVAEYVFLSDDPTDQSPADQDGFRYDPLTHTVCLILGQNIGADRLTLVIHGESTDVSPVTRALDSSLLGQDVEIQIEVLPGDFTGEGVVTVTDVVNVSSRVQPGQLGSNYDIFADIDRNNSISVTDTVGASTRVGSRLPSQSLHFGFTASASHKTPQESWRDDDDRVDESTLV